MALKARFSLGVIFHLSCKHVRKQIKTFTEVVKNKKLKLPRLRTLRHCHLIYNAIMAHLRWFWLKGKKDDITGFV